MSDAVDNKVNKKDSDIAETSQEDYANDSTKYKTLQDKEVEYLSEVAKKKGARAFAWLMLAILAILFVSTIILGIIGSKYFMGMLALCILCPIAMYIFLWIGKVLSK